MNLQINKTYKFRVNSAGKILTFVGELLSIEEPFIAFKDKHGIIFYYTFNSLISVEVLE